MNGPHGSYLPRCPARRKLNSNSPGVLFWLHLATGSGIMRSPNAGTGDSIITPLWGARSLFFSTPIFSCSHPFPSRPGMPRGSVSGQAITMGADETKNPRQEDGTWKFSMLLPKTTPWTGVSARSARAYLRALEAAEV